MSQTTIAPQRRKVNRDFTGPFEVIVEASVKVNAEAARRKAVRWVVDEVGNCLYPELTHLVIGKRTVWRFAVIMSLIKEHRKVVIGAVDVDAESGEVLADDKLRDTMWKNAESDEFALAWGSNG